MRSPAKRALAAWRLSLWVLIGCGLAGRALAETPPHWEPTGWGGGGFFFAAAYHPTADGVIYLGGDSCGVYKTEDHGRNWRIINHGLPDYAVYSLAVDRSHPETVYAATEAGLAKSVDGGQHWRVLPQTGRKELRITGERHKSIRAIAVDPRDGNNLYAASPGGKVYKSTDGGQTWAGAYVKPSIEEADGATRVQFGKITDAYFGDLAIPVALPAELNPADCVGIGLTIRGAGTLPKDCFLVLKTADGISYRSRNLREVFGQLEWQDVVLRAAEFALDPTYVKEHPQAAAAAPAAPEWSKVTRLDLACSGALPTEAVVCRLRRFFFATTGASAGSPQLITFRDFGRDPSAQVFGSLHLGPPPGGVVFSVAVAAADPRRVIAATEDAGLVLSTDAGRTWKALATPKKAAHATFDPSDAQVIYGAFFADGIRKSVDGGRTWHNVSTGLTAKCSIAEVAVSPGNSQDLYAIGSVDWNGTFFHSHDGGQSWTASRKIAADFEANPTLDSAPNGVASLSAPKNIAVNPRNPKQVFIAANWRPCWSDDGGVTWTERDRGADISCVTDIRFHQGKVYVTVMDEGTLVSDSDGQHWRQLWPLKHTPGVSGHHWRVAVAEVAGTQHILTTVTPWYKTPTCVIRSDDGGKTSSVITAGLPDYTIRPNTMWGQGHPRALAVDPHDPQLMYLGIDGDAADGKCGGGIFRSRDGGQNWTQLAHQPASRRMMFGLAVDPTDPRRLFWGACAQGGGVYRSEDRGETWKNVFPNENFVWNVHVTAAGVVYCAGQQLWRSTDHGTTWQQLTRLAEKRSIVGLEVHPRDPQTVWISAITWHSQAAGAVYKTADGGGTWQDITGDLPYIKPLILRFNPQTDELWAGNVGLYKLKQ